MTILAIKRMTSSRRRILAMSQFCSFLFAQQTHPPPPILFCMIQNSENSVEYDFVTDNKLSYIFLT
jgi:hypothetical protein